jgi:hypothetical protein
MVNYNLGKIYKIKCNVTGQIYIGSTCEKTLARRLAGHVKHYKGYLNGKYHNVSSFKVLENGDYFIVLLESVNCENNDELKARERHYIENNVCVNKVIPGRTVKEYYEDNKEKIFKNMNEYYQANKEKISGKKKNKVTCECGAIICKDWKSKHLKTAKHIHYIKNKDT